MVQLSIIIPHYNSTFLLAKLLRSIPYNSAVQVIIIDDNSDEFYQSELYNLQLKNNVAIYTNESNTKGAGASRNIGLEKAVGKWLLFADSDDYYPVLRARRTRSLPCSRRSTTASASATVMSRRCTRSPTTRTSSTTSTRVRVAVVRPG